MRDSVENADITAWAGKRKDKGRGEGGGREKKEV